MKDKEYNLFLISEALNDNLSRPIQFFKADNYTNAELYFRNFILDFKNKINYNLHKIGTINKKLELTRNKIFIANGYEIPKNKETIKEIKNKIDKAILEKDVVKQLEILFEGRKI